MKKKRGHPFDFNPVFFDLRHIFKILTGYYPPRALEFVVAAPILSHPLKLSTEG